MRSFLQAHENNIQGVLSGFDRLRFRGILRAISFPAGMGEFLSLAGIGLKHFKSFALDTTERIRRHLEEVGLSIGRPAQYLDSPKIDEKISIHGQTMPAGGVQRPSRACPASLGWRRLSASSGDLGWRVPHRRLPQSGYPPRAFRSRPYRSDGTSSSSGTHQLSLTSFACTHQQKIFVSRKENEH